MVQLSLDIIVVEEVELDYSYEDELWFDWEEES